MIGRLGAQCAVLLVVWPSPVPAQYYESERVPPGQERYVRLGVEFRDFQPAASNTSPDSLRLSYHRPLVIAGFTQGPLDLVLGYGTYPWAGGSRTAMFVSMTVGAEVPLGGPGPGGLSVPLMLCADFTKSELPPPEKNTFNVGSVGVGGGVAFRTVGRSVRGTLRLVAAAHYCIDGFSMGSGFSFATFGEATLLFPGVLALDGLVAGYRYRYQSWSMTNDWHDYRVFSHGPFVGVML